jgi:para-aminobenzoate synthetase component 1
MRFALSTTPTIRRLPEDTASLPLVLTLAPAPDPLIVFERLAGLPHLLFLDSAQSHPRLGRYSYIAADPFDWISVPAGAIGDPLAVLKNRLGEFRHCRQPGLPPFQGGAAGLCGYGLGRTLERLPSPRRDDFRVPDLAVGIYDWVIAFDHASAEAWIISSGFPESDPERRLNRAQLRLRQIQRWLERGTGSKVLPTSTGKIKVSGCKSVNGYRLLCSNFSRREYLEAVDRVLEYIRAGDCFQVNFAQRLLYPANGSGADLYCLLRQRNPAPFAGYFDLGDFVVASASPERFLCVQDGKVESRPIKGTRPRGKNRDEERMRGQELLASPKDRAENIMIVDLLRNDLGRVCSYGSVRVPALCELETYGFVHHLVSEVRGELRQGLGTIDLLRAAFPGGSVTGAPKIRAMEIIAELEPDARGPYCGCLGWFGFDGSMDTNILIRTFTMGGGWLQFPVGGGIVADSDPEREYDETWLKAEGMLKALE